MDATIVPKMQKHYPVLLKEIISVISPQHGGTFIDCTFGQGGYSKKILDFKNTKVIALDRDKESEKIANQLKENFEDRFIFKNIKFSQLSNLKLKNENKIAAQSNKGSLQLIELNIPWIKIFEKESFHAGDFNFFWLNIRENLHYRLSNYFDE